jgi:hypothetical protein
VSRTAFLHQFTEMGVSDGAGEPVPPQEKALPSIAAHDRYEDGPSFRATHFDRSVVENQVELLTGGAEVN